jgi:alpha-tubulin suppressor-like RCC1 family protein
VQIGNSIWTQIAPGDLFCAGLKSDGTVWAWGNNVWGQVGDGSGLANMYSPKKVGIDNNWIYVAAGGHQVLAKKANGDLWGWGSSLYGQLALDQFQIQDTPIQITQGLTTNWQMLSGGDHSIAMKSDGKIWAWGSNLFGELGNPAFADESNEIHQIGTDNWTMVEASIGNSAGIKSDGTLWIWGYNSIGQLGLGDTAEHTTPTQMGTANDWKYVTTGSWQGRALKTDNSLWAWGMNPGNGTDWAAAPTVIPCPQ